MIATVTLNPCIDKTVTVDHFDIYRMNRVQVLRTDPSGKGINVSKALHALGVVTLCSGFDYTDGTPSPLVTDLDALGIPHSFVPVKGALRLCTKIFDRERKHTIEINEGGASVGGKDVDAMLERVVQIAKSSSYLTLSGSLPLGVGADFYKRCLLRIHKHAPNCRVVVDAERDVLLSALEAAPYLIKPNLDEFEGTFQCKINSIKALDTAAREVLNTYRLSMICISMGSDGAYLADAENAYVCEPAKVEVRSLQGAGDSMVAGICMALEKCLPLHEILRYGIASAGALVMREGTQVGSYKDFEKILNSDLKLRQYFGGK